jgi:hypothetical protein
MHAFDRLSTGAAVLAVVCGGCAPGGPQDGQIAEAAGADTVPNGTELNGLSFNGLSFNGLSFNGVGLNGVTLDPLQLDQVRLGGRPLAGVSLSGGSLTATSSGGARVSGGDLTGAEIAGTLSNGAQITLHIDSVVDGPDPDIELAGISASVAGSSARSPLCGDASVLAIPLAGSWDGSEGTPTGGSHVEDPGVFTFACEGYALAKCVLFGYAPWRTLTECESPGHCASRSLSPFHEACTRMLRADYCGDGTATTRNGTQVDLWDDFGIQTDDELAWRLEAEWSPGGAVCVEETRWPTIEGSGVSVQGYIQQHCPSRWQTPGCGGPGSTFFTANGFDVPLDIRSLVRNRNNQPQQAP